MTINLPNGVLKEKQLPYLGDAIRTLLAGRIICLGCLQEYKAEVLIFSHGPCDLPGFYTSEIPFVNCPECDTTILNIGAANARVVLRRIKKRKHLRKSN